MSARKNRPGKCGTPGFIKPRDLTPEERLLWAIFGGPDPRSVPVDDDQGVPTAGGES